ncbi:unnamed protein product, partial [Owenia fusiformis]
VNSYTDSISRKMELKLLTIVFVVTFGQEDPVVRITDTASVRGIISYVPDNPRPAYNFLGIPYAAPPIGDNRFRVTQPFQMWTGERDATEYGSSCPQLNSFDYDEDCLFLNIWTPTLDPTANKAVMLYIHGGSMRSGSGMRNGTGFAVLQDVIKVAINYRLGVLGFWTTGDAQAPGNYGFLDQQFAIQWVRQHIAAFGGDPNRITIYGASAGGVSVSAQVLSPMNAGLVTRAISQSGVAIAANRVNPYFIETPKSDLIALSVGCVDTDPGLVVACMRLLDMETILRHEAGVWPEPVIDGTFMPDYPINLYNQGRFNKIPYILGFNRDEGWTFSGWTPPTRENIRTHVS